MEKLIELTKRKKELMENKNILVSVYSNASGFLYELMKVKGGTSLGYSSVRGDNDNGAFESYENALEDALDLIDKYDFSEYESECLKNEWHIGNYAYFLNENFPQ